MVVWLDLPMYQLIWRVLRRSWGRWRSKELLWGTNYERFWPQLMVWNKEDSLVWWIVTQHGRKRRDMRAYMSEPRWQHIQFLRLESSAEVEVFSRANGSDVLGLTLVVRVWFQNGKFADLTPNDETGDPDFTIHSLSELPKIIDQSR